MTSAQEWFSSFVEEFIKAATDPEAEIGISYEKHRLRHTEVSTEWTYVMGVFLSRLARKLGYFQEWGTLDFQWFKEDRINPVVAIEHENDYSEIGTSEIPKLLGSNAPLKVLVTYLDGASTEDILAISKESLGENLEGIEEQVEFLLVIGGALENHRDWEAFTYNSDDDSWKKIKAIGNDSGF